MADLKLENLPGTGPIIRADMGAGTRATADFIVYKKDGSEVFSVDYQGLPDPGGNQAKRQVLISLGDIPADADALENFLVEFRAGVNIEKVQLCIDTDTGDGTTNRQNITIKRSSDDGQVVSYTTPTDNPALSAATWTDMGTVTNAALSNGEYLYATYTKTASGLALSGLAILIDYTMTS